MCGGSPSAPAPPPVVPEAPRTPEPRAGGDQASRDRRRRLAAGGGDRSTILTSASGVSESGATAAKTLLGQ